MRQALTAALLITALSGAPFASAEPLPYNRVTLNESAQTEADNDLLVAVMFAQAEGRDAAQPADEINRRMDWAVAMVKDHPEVKVQTLGYQTSAIYDKSNVRGWRVNQSLRLESQDSRLLGDLIGRLQEQLQVQSIAYQVSDERRRSYLDALTDTALKRFQARARSIASSLGRNSYRVVRININDGFYNPAPIARGMVMSAAPADAAPAPPRIEAGTQQITVSIDGEIELSEN